MKKLFQSISKLMHRLDAFINRFVDLDLFMRRIPAIEKYIDTVITYPKTTFIITLIITVILFFGLLKIEFDNSMDVLMPGQDEEYLYYKKVQETYAISAKSSLSRFPARTGPGIIIHLRGWMNS